MNFARSQSGSTSPENASPARTDGKRNREGARTSGGKAVPRLRDQRFDESPRRPFHPKEGTREFPFGAPGGRALPISVTDLGAGVALDEHADWPLG